MKQIEKDLHYTFKDQNILKNALMHSSYINESRDKTLKSNERLEFLGDSVLSLITSEYLFTHFDDLPEGDLTKTRAAVVCEKTLAVFAREIKLGEALLLGHGEEQSNGRERDSVLADAFEAMIAAIFVDGGLDEVRRVFMPFITRGIDDTLKGRVFTDYKTLLQEIIQKNKEETLSYVLVGEEGPDHSKVFTVEVHLNSNVIASGRGRNKKEAEQSAAKAALSLMGE
ncbi:MAG: ribonuclease III [Bacillota bacterium]|nr:ribonuclease III [Bacillota bacterium]